VADGGGAFAHGGGAAALVSARQDGGGSIINGSERYDAVVVGAGFAGLYALHRLRGLGWRVRVFEAGDGVGGTWYWNRYPGARCDVESVQYCYQFSPQLQQEWSWSEKYATQPEILRYIEHVADRFDLRRDVQFGARVESANWNEAAGLWCVGVARSGAGLAADAAGSAAGAAAVLQVEAKVLILAVGALSTANRPAVPGFETFAGRSLHTGQWPHVPVDFSGQRVAVIGTGSSGIQCVPPIAAQAERLTVFQRTPNYATPAWNEPIDAAAQQAIKADYAELRARARQRPTGYWFPYNDRPALSVPTGQREAEFRRFWQLGGLKFMGAFNDLFTDPAANEAAARFVQARIRERVHDADVARRLMPQGVIGSKRLCVESGYFETFNRPNVALVDLRETPIERFTPAGLRAGGREYRFDVVVFATGFDAITGSLLRIDPRGREGLALRTKWADGPRSLLGLCVAGFPNLFTVNGPGSPGVLSNMVQSIEQHVEWIARCLEHLRATGSAIVEARVSAEDRWVEHCGEAVARTLRATEDSWYVGANVPGKPRVFMAYAGGFPAYVERCEAEARAGFPGLRFSTPGGAGEERSA
jgi:cyclohexanone monooxygenase